MIILRIYFNRLKKLTLNLTLAAKNKTGQTPENQMKKGKRKPRKRAFPGFLAPPVWFEQTTLRLTGSKKIAKT